MVRESLWHHFSSPQFWAPTGHVLSHYLPVVQFEKIGMEAVQTAWLLQLARLTARRRKHNLTISIAMSSAAAGMERDAAEGAAVAHVPGMDDCIAALKAERQALKRQLQQTSREVKAQAGSISSLCAMFVLVKLYWHSIVPLAPSSFPSQVFLVKLHCTCIAPLVLSIFLFQLCARRKNDAESWNRRANWAPKTSRGSWPSKWPVSSSSFFKTICLTEALVTAVSRGVSSSFLKTICLTEALETAVSKGVRQECGEVTRGRLPNDCCLPRHQKHVFACFGTCFCCGPKKLLRILPTIFADFVLARQSHSSCTHEKLLSREIEITMAWTQNY